ncbi:hypothetical protein JMM63_18735 [Rhodovulum sulfidophilum]|uniref:hypothetical protein n=1 Tax=Rhodovulum sulfidophilum TaxID=35806 RepID=UPI0019221136|nr:hypothetical protein [Rhodovulum sulfidophilum]MBL3597571.1 hypothetical protein [Rhodovulum sulfidophilum]
MARQRPFIDMHTHLFNARYLPLHGIFHSFGVPKLLAGGLAKLSNSITGISDFGRPDDEDPLDDSVVQSLMSRDPDEIMDSISRRARYVVRTLEDHAQKSADGQERLNELLSGIDDLSEAVGFQSPDRAPLSSRIVRDGISQKSVFSSGAVEADELDHTIFEAFRLAGNAVQDEEFLHDAAHLHLHAEAPSNNRALKAVFGLEDRQVGGLSQILLFVAVMVLSERARYRVLQIDYSRGKPSNGLDASHYVALLMDMQEPYAEVLGRNFMRPHFEFKVQMERMGKLAATTGGRLLSFGAVDPFRTDWREYVTHGVNHGASGFKIYPPMGVRPFDDRTYRTPVSDAAEQEYRDRAEKPTPSAHAQDAMADIIPYFARNQLRLFAHCTPVGFQAQAGYGVYSDPSLWRRGIEEANADNIWLFLGHGGGTTDIDWNGWASRTEDEFMNTFAYAAVRLAQDYDNVYLGLGYIFDILEEYDADSYDRFTTRLASLILQDKPANAKHHIREKLCYGTDWSMPNAIGRTRGYLEAFYEFFDRLEDDHGAPASYASNFFEGNARRFLGLPSVPLV